MRKFLYITTLGLCCTITACHSNQIKSACTGISTIVSCCKAFNAKCSKLDMQQVKDPGGNQDEVTAPLPAYSWDSKMMFY
ncbi:hypothetical protein [Aridibaculum aurantiacum]|uniref:hypothetical protein n=1 Tax=Aridibaculum aurantiacum TaxID=2810307 RepID=UPI001A96BEE5|nr:hypothetical protein [Aridibaculum aurantiacum]